MLLEEPTGNGSDEARIGSKGSLLIEVVEDAYGTIAETQMERQLCSDFAI
jgi:hypothetical protein